jgi:hypothetical protein
MKTSAKSLVLLIAAVCAVALFAPGASAAEPIEGVWSFNGGKVAVQAGPEGTLIGTVVAPTRFSNCTHPTGEKVWTEMRRQPDGSYWGHHQWYFDNSHCTPNPTLGLTAWRVLSAPNGSQFLRVCFSEPGSTSQPTIAADGTSAGATFGCSDSSLISPLPPVLSAAEIARLLELPSNKSCIGRRRMRVVLTSPVSDPFVKAQIGLTSGTTKRRAKLTWGANDVIGTLRLRGLTHRRFKVAVEAETALGHQLVSKRSYRLCRVRHKVRRHVA